MHPNRRQPHIILLSSCKPMSHSSSTRAQEGSCVPHSPALQALECHCPPAGRGQQQWQPPAMPKRGRVGRQLVWSFPETNPRYDLMNYADQRSHEQTKTTIQGHPTWLLKYPVPCSRFKGVFSFPYNAQTHYHSRDAASRHCQWYIICKDVADPVPCQTQEKGIPASLCGLTYPKIWMHKHTGSHTMRLQR